MRWLLAITVSALAHIGLLIIIAVAVAPDPVPQQPAAQSRLDISAYAVDQTDAVATAPEGERTAEQKQIGAAIGGAVVPVSRAEPAASPSSPAVATDQSGVTIMAVDITAQSADVSDAVRPDEGLVAATVEPTTATAVLAPTPSPLTSTPTASLGSDQVKGLLLQSSTAVSTPPDTTTIDASTPSGSRSAPALAAPGIVASPQKAPATATAAARQAPTVLADISLLGAAKPAGVAQLPTAMIVVGDLGEETGAVVTTLPPANTQLQEVQPAFASIKPDQDVQTAVVTSVQENTPQLVGMSLPATVTASSGPSAQEVVGASLQDETRPAQTAVPEAAHMTAALVWSGDGNGQVDPTSLAAIQSFMQPGDLAQSGVNSGTARDGIAQLLSSVPCARLQTTFVPPTGHLELRGHIPEDGLRAPILAALQNQIGSSIPVSDNTLILPRPTCGALAGIANVGLPQSTEQDKNPRVVGPDTHARVYRFKENDRLAFDLVGPDYPAYFYIDYFDANGMVVHLQPNEIVSLAEIEAKQSLVIGRDAQGQAALDIRVSPPFGQEIMVAFAASTPLYEGVRPLQELAAPYLEFLRDRVSWTRANTPDFKGEWVYFFVETSSR
ncbi:DUF4384 domain-containing protein [Meridianimarinicoccus aquatilis]|uniref:DUF4384 domain-containing protein n=1 Tax=Meridianimarinicoccus aquatilis TaxID=2552766 RepID=A0A4R6AMC1_9RHOB|nr:DUF4384 domain-containing protein [Fluviibacterium aquatile]TDL85491.1 DUF4384 domain-containing protein [Fluviibacterium aquatile]